MNNNHEIVNNVESLSRAIERVRKAQKVFSTYTENQVDDIFAKVALAACNARIPLAKLAVRETKMGVMEDKVIKNNYASEFIYNAYKNTKTCGVIEENDSFGYKKIAEPIGVISAIIPTTNPTSTVIYKILLALKTRNGIIISPHPRAKNSSIETARLLLNAAIKAGAPSGIIEWIDEPSMELSKFVMSSSDLILATGGPGMVNAAYSSGKPALGVGAGNVPAVIDDSADILLAVNSIIHSKTFDNGVICSSEQSVIVLESIYEKIKAEFKKRACYFLSDEEKEKLRNIIIINGKLNDGIVGKTACEIAKMAEIEVPPNTKILIGEVCDTSINEPFAHEKLSPILAMYKVGDFDDAISKAHSLILDGGHGHTSSIYIDSNRAKDKLSKFEKLMETGRVLINMPSAQGGIGDIYNFKLAPALTLGCGSWGGNSVSENVGVKHLLNIKTVVERRNNMLWFRAPQKVYIERGAIPTALQELQDVYHTKKVVIVTDYYLYHTGFTRCIADKLNSLGIEFTTFFDVESDPYLSQAIKGARLLEDFKPDAIIALGGGSALDAAKIMWLLYEHPEMSFHDMAARFMDIRKRIYTFPKMGEKAIFIAIPTTSGTGSEMSPFAVITDDESGLKYPIADYELMPTMAVIDADMMKNVPKGLTVASGIDALIHSLEAIVSTMATDYTDSLALKSIKMIFEYLPRAYKEGGNDMEAREKMADAAAMAGMAFANAFLGVCHSMAHKLGAYHHLPHGIANALMISYVIRYNSSEAPTKMGAFPKYDYPKAISKYAEIADYLSLGGDTNDEKVSRLIDSIEKLKEELDIKKSIKEYDINEKYFLDTLKEMSEYAFDDQCTGTNPRYPLIEEIEEMYRKAYYGE